MAPPPVNPSGGEISAAEAARSMPTPFLNKTYQLVDDCSVDDIISWNEDGSTFIVWNPAEFARDLLPKYFKHNNFSSFVRQLNTYGFRKVVPDRWEFSNEFFRKGDKRLLCDIQRRKIANLTPPAPPVAEAAPPPAVVVLPATSASDSGEEQVISSNSSQINNTSNRDWSSGNASNSQLVGENGRLRKENSELNKELTHMKSLCSNIYEMMSKFGANHAPAVATAAESSSRREKEPLDLMPLKQFCDDLALGNMKNSAVESESNSDGMESEDCRTRIFGVAIGSKRRRHSDGVAVQNEEELQLRQPGMADVKVEPLDDS